MFIIARCDMSDMNNDPEIEPLPGINQGLASAVFDKRVDEADLTCTSLVLFQIVGGTAVKIRSL